MKKIKKVLASTLAVFSAASALCIPMGASAETITDESGLYIKTSEVPDDVVSYARDMFSHFTYNDVTNLGFTTNQVSNMKLSKPFTVNNVGNQSNDYTQFYFPVLSDFDISAMFIVNVDNTDNSMNYQFGKDELSIALNNFTSSADNPVSICMGDDCCFTIDSNNETDILYTYVDMPTAIPDVEVVPASELDTSSVVLISEDNTYSDLLKHNMARTYIGIKLSVPYVDNYTYLDTNGKKHGTCWASCLGSLASYYANPSTGGSDSDASNLRYAAISKYGKTGSIDTAVSGVLYYSNVSMTKTNGKYSWATLKSKISKKSPAYTSWTASSSAHAMVLSGYRYENTAPNNTAYYGIYAMDPNNGNNVLVSYNGTYTINGNSYSWSNSAAK